MQKKRELVMGACLGPDFISLFDPKNGRVGQTYVRLSTKKPAKLVGIPVVTNVSVRKRARARTLAA